MASASLAINAMPIGYYQNQHNPEGYKDTHLPSIQGSLPIESFGLCSTTKITKGTIRYRIRIINILPTGKISKVVRYKNQYLKWKSEISHTDEPEVLADGYCIDCWDKK